MVHLGLGATHDPGDGLGAAVGVADEQVARQQISLDVVERREGLSLVGEPDHETRTPQPIEVERVRRLPALEHHVVRDVDDVGDGTHAREREPALHPLGRRSDRNAHAARGEPGRAIGSVHHHRDHVRVARDVDRRFRDIEREAEMRGQVPGHADDRHRVGPVRCDREIEHHVVQPEDVAHIGTELGPRVQRENAVVLVAQSEFS